MTLIPIGPLVIGKDGGEPRFALRARVYREELAHSERATPFARVRLTHAKGNWLGFFPLQQEGCATELTEGQAIRVEARRFKHRIANDSFLVDRWEPMPASEERALRLDMLPSALCPRPYLVEKLVEMLDRLTIPALREFVAAVLCEPNTRDRFLTAPASLHAHQSRPGGLIEHTMHVAWFVASMGSLSDTERELGVVAALVHDIGKLRVDGTDGETSALGAIVGHDAMTLEMLAAPLQELEQRWPDGAISLRHLLVVETDPKSFSERIEHRVGLVLRFADQWSAHYDKSKRAYRQEGKRHGAAFFGKQRFWRPQPPRSETTRRRH